MWLNLFIHGKTKSQYKYLTFRSMAQVSFPSGKALELKERDFRPEVSSATIPVSPHFSAFLAITTPTSWIPITNMEMSFEHINIWNYLWWGWQYQYLICVAMRGSNGYWGKLYSCLCWWCAQYGLWLCAKLNWVRLSLQVFSAFIFIRNPTDSFTALEFQNASHNAFELHAIPRYPDVRALKLRKGRTGDLATVGL